MSYEKQLKKMDKADLRFICRELGIVCNLNIKTRQQMITKILKPFNCFDLDDCKKRARNRMKRINKKKYKMNEEQQINWDKFNQNNLGAEMMRQLKLEREEEERKKREEERKEREEEERKKREEEMKKREEERKKREEMIEEVCRRHITKLNVLKKQISAGGITSIGRQQLLFNYYKKLLDDCKSSFDSMNFLP